MTTLSCLPFDLIETITRRVARGADVEDQDGKQRQQRHPLFALACVNKYFHTIIRNDTNIWPIAWASVLARRPAAAREAKRAPASTDERTLVGLLHAPNCMACGTKRDSPKVYWSIGARCCRPCLNRHTVRADTLSHRFVLSKAPWKGVPFLSAKTAGMRLYLAKDVDRVLLSHYGIANLREYDEHVLREHRVRTVTVSTWIVDAAEGRIAHVDLEMSATYCKTISACARELPRMVDVLSSVLPQVLREIAREKRRRVSEANHRARIAYAKVAEAEAERCVDVAFADGSRDGRAPCPLCSCDARDFTYGGLMNHVKDVHVRGRILGGYDRRACEYHRIAHRRWTT
jgi:hypothetical protein